MGPSLPDNPASLASGPAGEDPLAAFVAGAPRPQRLLLGALMVLASRPRGRALLGRLAPLDQLAGGLLALGRYDEPGLARRLGWDAEAVRGRGRELRRREGRP